MTKILEFTTEAEALTCVGAIDQLAATWWQSRGFTVIDGELVPKNSATGQDDLEAARTTTWDTVKESPDGTFWIYSLTEQGPKDEQGAYEWSNWKDTIDAETFGYTEKDLPIEWITADEEE